MSRQIQTITEQIYNAIRADIFARRIHFGEKLTTRGLQERLGVSSTPIREALARLEKDGLVIVRPNAGMQVVSYTEKDVYDIYTLMTELDATALRLACDAGQMPSLTRELAELQAEAAQCLLRQEVDRWEELSDEFHLIFYRYADNSRLSDAANKTRSQLTVFSQAYQAQEVNQQEIQRQHDIIVHCLMQGDPYAAEEALRRHFAASLEKALASLSVMQA